MKKTFFIAITALALFTSCGDNKKTTTADTKDSTGTTTFTSDDTEKKGSYNVDGKTFEGKITLQTMAKSQYSVLCQQDDPFSLLQITFANEKEARSDATLKASDDFYSMDGGDVQVSLSAEKEYTTKSNSTGTITVKGNSVTLKDVQLFDAEKKAVHVVNATLSF